MDEERNVVYSHDGILFSYEEEWSTGNALAWMSLENIISKISHSPNTTYFMNLFIGNIQIGKSVETKCISEVAQGWGRGGNMGCDC